MEPVGRGIGIPTEQGLLRQMERGPEPERGLKREFLDRRGRSL
jgi:hypothetical protein